MPLILTTADGKTLDSLALKASPLVIVFGAAWCPECRQEAPDVQKVYLTYNDRGVTFLFVLGKSTDSEIRDGWKRWSREDIYQGWGLYNDYQIRYVQLKAA